MSVWFNTHAHQPLKGQSGVSSITPWEAIPKNPFSCGIHPWDCHNAQEQLEIVKARLNHPLCVALGECGLDRKQGSDYALQLEVFEEQIQIAKSWNLPLILHCVRAHNDGIRCLKKGGFRGPFLLHSYQSNDSELQQWLRTSARFSFSAAVLRREKLARLVHQIPPDRLFIETDDDPTDLLPLVGQKVANLLGFSELQLQTRIWQNARELFCRFAEESWSPTG